MAKSGLPKIHRYGVDFKLRAVQMSNQPGVLIKDVAQSLCIHPFMLSKWRKQVRDGELSGKPPPLDRAALGELQQLRELELKYKQLQMEHDLLKKVIRFVSERKARSSRSSRQTGKAGRSR